MCHLHLRPFARLDAEGLLGALVHLGAPRGALAEAYARAVPGGNLSVELLSHEGVLGARARTSGEAPAISSASGALPASAGRLAAAALGRLEVERPPAGAEPFGSLLACCLALDLLGVSTCSCEALPLGPGPATAATRAALAAARGATVRGVEVEGPTLGPLGVALAAALCSSFGPAPALVVEASGVGFDAAGRPALEAIVGSRTAATAEELVVLAANLDDLTAEVLATLVEECLGAGALDAWLVPALMKKGRPGHVVEALCRPETAAAVEERLFRCSTTLGVRRTTAARTALERRWEEAQTPWGPVRVKLGLLDGEVVNRAPEFEDCRRLAAGAGVAVKEVYAAALGPR